MTDFNKGKMFLRLSPDDRRAGEHGAPAGEKDDYTPVIPVPKDAPAPDWNKLRPTKATGDPVWTWPYHTAENELALYVALWKPKDPNGRKKKVIRPATWDGTEWKLKGLPAPRPLYRLPAILESPDKFVIVVEGEKCADAARDGFPAHTVTTWAGGSGAEDKTDWSPLAGRTALLLADRDASGRKAMKGIADKLAGMDANVSVHLPDGEDKQDIANWLKEDGDEVTRIRIEKEAKPWIETDSHAAVRLAALSPMEYERMRKGEAKRLGIRLGALDASVRTARGGDSDARGRTQSDLLIAIAIDQCTLFPFEDKAFADIDRDGHRETWAVGSKGFAIWLRERYFTEYDGAPNNEAFQSAINMITAKAEFDGAESKVCKRVGSDGGSLYLDLCNPQWEAVEITSTGWRIVAKPELRFTRTLAKRELPTPARDGRIEDLHRFLNLTADDFVLAVAWLLAALSPTGPYPVLVLTGEQGSAKSTCARVLHSLVDPHAADLRSPPRDEHDLFVTTRSAHVLVFDNLGEIPPKLSDTLCRIATGAALSTRELYTDDGEVVFSAMRPMILNGIDNIVGRSDLADRAIFLTLRAIPDTDRKTEEELWRSFEEVRPKILGALLDATVKGVERLPNIRLDQLPRMADFARWVVACEPPLFPEGPFMAAYTANRDGANAAMVEGNPLANAVRTLMDEQEGKVWEGTPTELYDRLKEIVGEATTKGKEWPANAQALSRRTNSLASTLRPFGIEINREKRSGGIRHIVISARPESAHRIAPIAPNAPNAPAGAENAMIDCATTRPIAPGASEGGGGRGRNGRNSTASFGEADESAPPPTTSNATDRHTAERTAPTDSSADDLVDVEGRAAITEHDGGRPRHLCPHLLFPNDPPTDL